MASDEFVEEEKSQRGFLQVDMSERVSEGVSEEVDVEGEFLAWCVCVYLCICVCVCVSVCVCEVRFVVCED